MARVLISEENLTNTANAIREKTNKTDPILLTDFKNEISNIETADHTFEDALLSGELTKYENDRITEIGTHAFYRYNAPGEGYPPIDFSFPKVKGVATEAFSYCGIGTINFAPQISFGPSVFSNSGLKHLFLPYERDVGSDGCFREAKELISVNMPNLESIKNSMFDKCSNLKEVNLPNAGGIGFYAFERCSKLEKICLPKVRDLDISTFESCSNLKIAHFPSLTSLSENYSFMNCSKLDTLILPYEGIVSLTGVYVFNGTPIDNETGHIYVPDDFIEDYKIATNWAEYADQFKKLSELDLYAIKITSDNHVINLLAKNKTVKLTCDYNYGINREDYIGVNWTIEGNGEIDLNGIVTPTSSAQDGDILKITATSTYNNSISDTIEIKIISKELKCTIDLQNEEWIESNESIDNCPVYISNGSSMYDSNIRHTAYVNISGYTFFTIYIKANSNSRARTYLYTDLLGENETAALTYGSDNTWVKFSCNLDGQSHIFSIVYNREGGNGTSPDKGYFYIKGEEE